MKEFKDKVAVVTGAASGIGRGMAETFVAAGMKVVLADIEQGALEESTRSLLATGADVHPVVTDVSKSEQVETLAKRSLSNALRMCAIVQTGHGRARKLMGPIVPPKRPPWITVSIFFSRPVQPKFRKKTLRDFRLHRRGEPGGK